MQPSIILRATGKLATPAPLPPVIKLGRHTRLTNRRVFEHLHKAEIKKAKEEAIMTSADLDTITHPNEYFKRSFTLKHLDGQPEQADVKMES
jgi:hypothetical protein